jgi:Holliday junction resolvase RusA-like endonuclease
MVKDDLNNLISVPIDLKSKHIFVDDDNEILERRRFINKKSIYYDASRLFERPTQDPI